MESDGIKVDIRSSTTLLVYEVQLKLASQSEKEEQISVQLAKMVRAHGPKNVHY